MAKLCTRENVDLKQKDGIKRCSGIKTRQGYNYRLLQAIIQVACEEKISSAAENSELQTILFFFFYEICKGSTEAASRRSAGEENLSLPSVRLLMSKC